MAELIKIPVLRACGTGCARCARGARPARQALPDRGPQRSRHRLGQRAGTSSASGVGEPDFDTPAHIADAGVAAIRSGFTRYTAVEGIAELKDAIAGKFRRDNGLEYTRPQILVSTGAKQTIYNLVMAVIEPGDEVVIPAPYWVSYPGHGAARRRRAGDALCGPGQGYKISPSQLEAAITRRTRLLILNSPCNPTGAAYTRAELVELGEVLLRHPRVLVCTDDMYEHIYWGLEPFCSLPQQCRPSTSGR